MMMIHKKNPNKHSIVPICNDWCATRVRQVCYATPGVGLNVLILLWVVALQACTYRGSFFTLAFEKKAWSQYVIRCAKYL